MPFIYCLMAVFLCSFSIVRADITVLDLNSGSSRGLNDYAEVLEDKSSELTLTDILLPHNDRQFRSMKLEDDSWNKKHSLSAYWFRLNLRNTSRELDWYFFQWGSLNRSVNLYLASNVDGKDSDFIALQPVPHARAAVYHLRLLPEKEYTLYYRIQDKTLPLYIAPHLRASIQFIEDVKYSYPFTSILVGGLFMLFIYNIFYFLHLRDESFLALALFILTFTLEMGGHSWLWQGVTWMREHLYGLGPFFGMLSVSCVIILLREWFCTLEYQPGFDKFWCYAFWCSIGFAVISPLIPYSMFFLGIWIISLIPLGVLSLFISYRRGMDLPYSILLAGVVFLVSIMPSLLHSLKLMSATQIPFIAEVSIAGLLLALMLLSHYQSAQMRSRNEQVERVAAAQQARDEFLTTMSHELRTPMNSVVSAGQLLKLSRVSAEQLEYISRLNTSSRHMLSLINDILDLARMDQQSIQIDGTGFRLSAVLRQTEQLLTEQARKHSLSLVIDNRFHPLKKQLSGDPMRLQQILLNLLSNALKFTERGEVRLTITPQTIGEEVTLLFEVADTGIGIAKKRQAELFQSFMQADSSTSRIYGGSGLGLAISAKLVHLMGGELQVESDLGRGSRFFFSLTMPLVEPISEEKTVLPVTESKKPITALRVLLVDDNEMNRFFNSQLLESLGVTVKTSSGGAQTLDVLRHHTFDLVFMDVSMPGIDGYQITRRIRTHLGDQQIVIIALTAHAISGERERCLAAGMDDYLPKPFTLQELENMLYQHRLNHKQVFN